MNSAKSWLPTMLQCPERSCEKSLPATRSSDGAGGEVYPPPYISQFSFYGLLNPSKTSKIIIWPNLKNHPEKWKIFKNTSKFDKNRGGWFKPGSAGLRARCRARKNPRGLDALRRGRGQPPCGLQLQQLRK